MEINCSKEHIIQNLLDAGCDKQFIDSFLEKKEYVNSEQIQLLQEQRNLILDKLHKAQKTIVVIETAIEILSEDGQ